MIRRTLSVIVAVGVGAATVAVAVSPVTAAADELTDRLEEVLGDEVTAFDVVELDVAALATSLEEGKATLPVVTEKGELGEVTLAATPAHFRDEGVDTGVVRTRRGAEHVALPAEPAYRLGDCPHGDGCATATIIDDAATMASGVVVSAGPRHLLLRAGEPAAGDRSLSRTARRLRRRQHARPGHRRRDRDA